MLRSFSCGFALLCLTVASAANAQEANLWNDLVTQGQRAMTAKDYAHAEQLLLKALHEAERFAADDWRVGVTEESLGQVYIAEKKFGEADSALTRALSIVGGGDDPVQVASVNFDIAKLQFEEGRPADAVSFARKALSTYETALGGSNEQTAAALCLLGDSLRAGKNFSEAEAPLRRCADIRQDDGGIDTTDFADALHSLALTYVGEGKYALAEPRFTLAEKIRESKLGLTSPLLAQTMQDHAALLKVMGREKDAERLMVLVSAIRRNENRSDEKKNAR